ncbi:MAG: FAD-dependent monooxygenase [Pseudomonadota bacterium]
MSAALPDQVDVLIVGAGPTGLLMANLLGVYGVDCLVVERNAGVSTHPKAILLDDEGLRALQAAGLAEEVRGHVIEGYGARYYDPAGTCFAKVDAPLTEHGYYRRNSFLQPDLERILLRGLDRFRHSRCAFGAELADFSQTDASVTARTGSKQINCKYLMGCDGGRSFVRERLGIKMPGRTDPRDWVVADTLNDPDDDRFSKFFCDPARPMVSIPAPGGGRRYEFMVMPGEDEAALLSLDAINSVLGRFRRFKAEDIVRAIVYRFHARIADHFHSGRVFIAGDAAHLSPPFAGQGMNAGLRDAFNLAWKVAGVVQGRLNGTLLQTYEQERHGPAAEMIDYAVALGDVVMPRKFDETTQAQIQDALGLVDGQVKPKPQAAYGKGFVAKSEAPGQTLVGRPCPQPSLGMSGNAPVRLDDILGAGFAWLKIGVGTDVHESVARAFGAKQVGLSAEQVNGTELSVYLGSTLLIRPDRFVGAEYRGGPTDHLSGQLQKFLA